MSRLGDLMSERCPRGVPYERLGGIARIRNGRDHKMLGDGPVPVYGSGGVMRFVDAYAYDKPSVLIPRKGSLGNLFYVDVPFWTVDTIFYTEVDERRVDPKFLYYQLATMGLGDMNQAGGVPSQTQAVLNELRIPLPDLVVQREIVNILDAFSHLVTELEEELEARQRQYEHYRDRLLDFRQSDVVWSTMGSLAEIGTGGRNTNEALIEGAYPFYVRSQDVRRLDSFDFDETAVITSGDGVGVGKIFHFAEGKYALHQRAYRIRVTDPALRPKFLYHLMRAEFLPFMESAAVHSSVTSVRKPMLERFPVPLPSLDQQDLVVSVLDSFDCLTGDPAVGLPAEIAARRRQYEYYRDRLLSFKELVS